MRRIDCGFFSSEDDDQEGCSGLVGPLYAALIAEVLFYILVCRWDRFLFNAEAEDERKKAKQLQEAREEGSLLELARSGSTDEIKEKQEEITHAVKHKDEKKFSEKLEGVLLRWQGLNDFCFVFCLETASLWRFERRSSNMACFWLRRWCCWFFLWNPMAFSLVRFVLSRC